MSNENSPVSCVQCGIDLGFASPGAVVQCWKCGRYIQASAQTVGAANAIATGLVAIGIGVVIVLGLKALSDFLDSL